MERWSWIVGLALLASPLRAHETSDALKGEGEPRVVAAGYLARGHAVPSPIQAALFLRAGARLDVLAALMDADRDGWPRLSRLEEGLELDFAGYRILVWLDGVEPRLVVTGYDASGQRMAPPVEPLPPAATGSRASGAEQGAAPPAVVVIAPELAAPAPPGPDGYYAAYAPWAPSAYFFGYSSFSHGFGPPHHHHRPPHVHGHDRAPGSGAGQPAPSVHGFIGQTPILYPAGQVNLPAAGAAR